MSLHDPDFWRRPAPPPPVSLPRTQLWWIAAAVLGAAIMMVSFLAQARPPAGADMSLAPWFQSLGQPLTGYPCCSIADCRAVQSRTNGDHFEVFIDRKTFGADAPDAWVAVPPDNILHRRDNPVGEPIACWFMNEVRCFVQGSAA
jgi:hypothetical protein